MILQFHILLWLLVVIIDANMKLQLFLKLNGYLTNFAAINYKHKITLVYGIQINYKLTGMSQMLIIIVSNNTSNR